MNDINPIPGSADMWSIIDNSHLRKSVGMLQTMSLRNFVDVSHAWQYNVGIHMLSNAMAIISENRYNAITQKIRDGKNLKHRKLCRQQGNKVSYEKVKLIILNN